MRLPELSSCVFHAVRYIEAWRREAPHLQSSLDGILRPIVEGLRSVMFEAIPEHHSRIRIALDIGALHCIAFGVNPSAELDSTDALNELLARLEAIDEEAVAFDRGIPHAFHRVKIPEEMLAAVLVHRTDLNRRLGIPYPCPAPLSYMMEQLGSSA